MISSIKNIFNQQPKRNIDPVVRDFPCQYLSDDALHQLYCRQGYVLLKNCIPENHLESIRELYRGLTQMKGFAIDELFLNSGRFESPEIRAYVMDGIGRISRDLLPLIFDENVYDSETTGAFQIKPPSKKSALNPHQDSPVIDETAENAMFVWIPLTDVNESNGAVSVLPGSHLLGNHQRSLNVPWVFEKHTEQLWKHMEVVNMNAGDVLCWDTALIHASTPNTSDELRLAITTTLLPKHYQMVEFYQDKEAVPVKIEKYRVEKSFWESQDIMKRPPCPPNELLAVEDPAFPVDLTKRELIELIRKSRG